MTADPDVVDLRMEGLGPSRLVHRGAFSTLYRAQQLRFNREVAVKVFEGRHMDDRASDQFLAECRLMGRLSAHPNVITVFDSTVARRRPILVSEWFPEGTLSDRVRNGEDLLDWREATTVAVKIAGALETAHRLGVLHRNLKLQNVFVNAFREPLLGDFQVVEGHDITSRSSDAYDRLVHAAPEIWRGDGPSVRSEVYALASMTVEMMTGLPAYAQEADDSLVEVAARAEAQQLPDLAAIGVPHSLSAVLARGLSGDPSERAASALAWGRVLQAVQLHEGQAATRLQVQPETPIDRQLPHPTLPMWARVDAGAGPRRAETTPPAAPVAVRAQPLIDEVRGLVASALDVLGAEHHARLQRLLAGFDEPLRVAIAGKVKAGKSTLLNALVGEELAPTDAEECTKVVTWYRDAHSYGATLHPISGPERPVPFARRSGAIEVDLGVEPTAIDRLVIDWPSSSLRRLTLIDTPGLESVSAELSKRAAAFLLAGDVEEGGADAVIYLMRHLHGSDLRFLESFHERELANPAPINAIGVLSRADEVGVGRLDALDSAHRISRRYQGDPKVRRLCQTIVPVAGLLAASGASLRQEEFAALTRLVSPGVPLDEMLVSADRFSSHHVDALVSPAARMDLLERFGLFGVRVATSLLRRGLVTSPSELSAALVAQSGLPELRELLLSRFASRRDVLKSTAALAVLEILLRSADGRPGAELAAAVERVKAGAHEVAETQLLAAHRARVVVFREDEDEEIDRLLGIDGLEPAARVGLPGGAGAAEIRARLEAAVLRWSRRAENPLSTREVVDGARVLVRSCEGMLAALGDRGALEPAS